MTNMMRGAMLSNVFTKTLEACTGVCEHRSAAFLIAQEPGLEEPPRKKAKAGVGH